MNGLIVKNSFTLSANTEEKIKRLQESFLKKGVKTEVYTLVDNPIIYQSGDYNLDFLKPFSFCIFLDKDRYLSYAIESRIPLFNSARSIELCDDKMLTYIALKDQGIRTPITFASPLNFVNDPSIHRALPFLLKVEEKLGYPLIIKEAYGSLGKQVYLIHDRNELIAYYIKLHAKPHLYQEFINFKPGTDYRIITIGGKSIASMQRSNPNEFRANIALGGRGESVSLPPNFYKMAEKVSDLLGLDYAGIDIFQDENGDPILNEVNSNAFFHEIEKVSGIDVTLKLVEHILSKLKGSE